ncbi:hypothetical protein [Streptomyces sp. HB132]|uniref:hypothetical protein n=1 Tax=Streptomyces sp. HB132 TaxID=767388 RepID=UPI00195F70D1|nr:hypothetical protein [Streptomyces sp. HB132]MBM7437076.1 hypothetical protein [Streptomyces sp. HB132]
MRLTSLFTIPRVLRHSDAIGAGLPPDDAVVLDAPDPSLRVALAAAAAGHHAPAAELLAATREHAQWEHRDTCVSRLARASLHHPGWLDSWLEDSPEDPDAVLVKADQYVYQAWKIRTGARARHVEADQFQAFHTVLLDAVPVISAAAELNPDDPVPWRVALTQARGIQAPREFFDTYLAEANSRDPHHEGCHIQALQYLCAKWYGSHEEMFAFAERAADHAPPGSKLHALPLQAVVEYLIADEDTPDPDPYAERAEAAVTRAQALSDSYAPGDREAAGFRNHLALVLWSMDRYEEALTTFRSIGVHATTYPWTYFGEARAEFLEARSDTRVELAMKVPFFRPSPGPPATGTPDWERELAPRSVAIASTGPTEVAHAALICGHSLRTAPAGNHHTYVEIVPDPVRAKRAALLPEDPLTAAADNFTTAEEWPALVLHRTPERSSFTLLHRGRKVADHAWETAAPAADHARAAATATALARVYGLSDPRPLAHILRAAGDPARHQGELVAALGLPPLPAGYGGQQEILAGLPGARVLARRGFLAGMRDTLTTKDGVHPEAPPLDERHPARWWVLRTAALLLFTAAAVYAWWTPDIGWFRSTVMTLLAVDSAARLVRALRRRPVSSTPPPATS